MKGITLPVNVLVLVAIAVIVLMGLVGLYFIGFSPFGQASGVESVKNTACRDLLIAKRCLNATNTITITKFDANKNGVNDSGTSWNWATGTGDDNLAALCYNYFGARNESQCKSVCTCVGMGISGGGGLPPGCTCPPIWIDDACSPAGGCPAGKMHQTRTCNPPGCGSESQCIDDAACTCSCNWVNLACGGVLNCDDGPPTPPYSWEEQCDCTPNNCGTCSGGANEGDLQCSSPPNTIGC